MKKSDTTKPGREVAKLLSIETPIDEMALMMEESDSFK